MKCCLFLFAALLAADDLVKPDKLSIHTWVREDLFAGWMVRDSASFERGVQKLNRYLRDYPDDLNAVSWLSLVEVTHLRTASEKKDEEETARRLAALKALRERVIDRNPNHVGGHIILGSAYIFAAPYIQEGAERASLYRDGRQILARVPVLQGAGFDKLPPHMKGELWSQIALASDRLEERAERDKVLDVMLEALKNTPYEARAKRWKSLNAVTADADRMCITCHEPGRLKPTMARLGLQ